jgi:hypothetical protein
VVLGVAAYVNYPKVATAAPEDAVQTLAVVAPFTPNAINVNQTPDPQDDGFSLQVVLHVGHPQPQQQTAYVQIDLPPTAWGSRKACAIVHHCVIDAAGLKDASFYFPGNWVLDKSQLPADREELTFNLKVWDTGSNLSRNDEYVSVLTPPISFQVESSLAYVKVSTLYAEQVPGGGAYTWNTGAEPVYLSGFDRWTATSAGTLLDTVSPTLDSGIDLGVQDRNGNLQFIAGIVVGAAGGALIGALQEYLDARPKTRRAAGDAPAS